MKDVKIYINDVYVLDYFLFFRNCFIEVVIGEKFGFGFYCFCCLCIVYDVECVIGLNDVSKNQFIKYFFS